MECVATRQSVVIIDDHPLFRKGVSQLIAMDPNLALLGEAPNGRDGVELVREHQPDLVLLDMNMKDMNGIETLKAIKAFDSNALVVMLTVSDSETDILTALRAGADGYLLKDMEPEELRARLSSVAQGSIVVSPSLRKHLARALNEDARQSPHDDTQLTEREKEILNLLAAGRCNKLIGRELAITEGTVKVHVKHILKKLNLRSRLEAAVWALEHKH
jgi:two-component system, NarL family, nitrate/nitrite response regulator NarL